MIEAKVQTADVAKSNASILPEGVTEALVFSISTVIAVLAAVVILYLVKSALGINLMRGPSPLHNLLYHFVR